MAAEISNNPEPSCSRKKKNFCIYCKELCLNFARHLEVRHGNELEVQNFKSLPKGNF